MKQLRVDCLRDSYEGEGTGFMKPFHDSRVLLNLHAAECKLKFCDCIGKI